MLLDDEGRIKDQRRFAALCKQVCSCPAVLLLMPSHRHFVMAACLLWANWLRVADGLQGVDPDLRQAVWPVLLRLFLVESTDAERQLLCSELGQSHEHLLAQAQVKPVLCKELLVSWIRVLICPVANHATYCHSHTADGVSTGTFTDQQRAGWQLGRNQWWRKLYNHQQCPR